MTSNTNSIQREIILEFMKRYPFLATNTPDKFLGRDRCNKRWEELTNKLNENGPPVKNLKAWKKTWADFKNRAKSKLAKNIRSLKKTGGGPFKEVTLTSFEDEVIELANIKAAASGIPNSKSFGIEVTATSTDVPLCEPSTSRKHAENVYDEVEHILKELMSDSETSDIHETPPLVDSVHTLENIKKIENTRSSKQNVCSQSPEKESKLQMFKQSATAREQFQKDLIDVLSELKDLKIQEISVLKQQTADYTAIANKKLRQREREIEIAIKSNELKQLELELRK